MFDYRMVYCSWISVQVDPTIHSTRPTLDYTTSEERFDEFVIKPADNNSRPYSDGVLEGHMKFFIVSGPEITCISKRGFEIYIYRVKIVIEFPPILSQV